VPVAGLERGADGGEGLLRLGLEDAEAKDGHLHAVVRV
jgi:hypothetical protein